jgi:hypothetical protein
VHECRDPLPLATAFLHVFTLTTNVLPLLRLGFTATVKASAFEVSPLSARLENDSDEAD